MTRARHAPRRQHRAADPVPAVTRRETLAAFVVLACVVVAMWGGTLRIALHQDDYWQAGGVGSPWRALTASAVRAMWALAGPNPVPYHVCMLLAHALASTLVYAFARTLGARAWIAGAAAVAFAASSTHAYVLYSVVTSAEAPAATCVLLSALAWMRGRAVWSIALFLCALACKESVVLIAPAFALLPRGARALSWKWLGAHAAIGAAWLALVSAMGGMNEQVWARLYQPASFSEAVNAFAGYVTGALDVFGVRVDAYHNVPRPVWPLVIAVAGAIAVIAARSPRFRGPVHLGAAWFTLAIVPFTTTRSMFMLYYLYAPLAGVAACAAWAAERARVGPAAALAASAVLIAGSTWTLHRTETARLGDFDVHAQSSLRHAQVARNVLASLAGVPLGERVQLVYPRRYPAAARPNRGWFDRNVFVAISDGRALRLTNPGVRVIEPVPRAAEPLRDWTRVYVAWDGTPRAVIAPSP